MPPSPADDELLPADLALGVGHAAFLRRFRPRHTVGRSCSRVTAPRSNVLYRACAAGGTPAPLPVSHGHGHHAEHVGQLCLTARLGRWPSGARPPHQYKQSVRYTQHYVECTLLARLLSTTPLSANGPKIMDKVRRMDEVRRMLQLARGRDLTQAELAKRIGESQQVVNNWKRRGAIPGRKLAKVARALGVSVEEILTGQRPRADEPIDFDPETLRLARAFHSCPLGTGRTFRRLLMRLVNRPPAR